MRDVKTSFWLTRRGMLAGAIGSLVTKSAIGEAVAEPSPPANITPTVLTERLLHCTALLESLNKRGTSSVGTGFFFNLFLHQDTSVLVLVTNRHVLEDSASVFTTLTYAKPDGSPNFGKTKRIQLTQWLFHPDPAVDLAILPLAPALNPLLSAGEKFVFAPTDQSLIPTDSQLRELTPLEDVLIIGYPDGISDTVNNVPVLRKGITATPAYLNFRGEPKFLLDAAIFPGSSGSPVFLFNQGSWPSRAGGLSIGTRINLLGVVFAVAQHQSDGQIVIRPAPTQANQMVQTLIPNNIGLCIRAEKVLDFEPVLVKLGVMKSPDGYIMRSEYNPP